MVNATVARRRAKSDLSARRRHVSYLERTWMKSFLTDELGGEDYEIYFLPQPQHTDHRVSHP